MFNLLISENKVKNHHFIVKNHTGEILYLIKGDWGKKGDFVNLYDLQGELLLQAKQVNASFFLKFELIHQKKKIGSFQKHPGFFGLRDIFFTLQPQNWIIKGDFEKLDFIILENKSKISKVNKLLKKENFLYSLKVKRKADIPIVSLLSILLDHYSRKKQKYNKFSQKNYNPDFINYPNPSRLVYKKNNISLKR